MSQQEYRITKQFIHNGITIGRGESLPDDLSYEDIDRLRAAGHIAKVNPDGTIESPTARIPNNIEEYLRGPDLAVIQRVRAHVRDPELLQEIMNRTKRQARSPLFHEALSYALDLLMNKKIERFNKNRGVTEIKPTLDPVTESGIPPKKPVYEELTVQKI